MSARRVVFMVDASVTNEALNGLFDIAWPQHVARDFAASLARSITWVCAYREAELIGFVNAAWDGGVHASSSTSRCILDAPGVAWVRCTSGLRLDA